MAYEMKEGQGSAFINDRKESESHADFTGKILIDGQERWLNIWKKKTKDGATWLSVSTRPIQAKTDKPVFDATKAGGNRSLDDDLDTPF